MTTAAPSLSLRSLLGKATASAAFGRASTTAGLTPASKALAAVSAARSGSGVTLVVVPTDRDVEQMTADARFFYGALEGASAAGVEQAVLPLPSIQVDPYRGMTPHFRVAAARARALHAAASGTARLIVASAAALLPRVSPHERLLRASIELRAGSEIEPQRLADLLVDAGFSREEPVDEHGAFAVRGGIVDVFPAADTEPVRIEFVGDIVESLRRFDPSTQRSTGATDQVHIVPARERFDEEGISILDFLSASRRLHLVVSEYEQVQQQAVKIREQLENSARDAAARGHVAAMPVDQAFIDWTEIERRSATGARLEELSLEDEAGVEQVSCQPAMEFRGRVGDWVADIRQARERGDTVLFVADSAGRAERTVEILRDYEIVAVPVEDAGAHAAAVLIAVGTLSRGFRLAQASLQVYAETDVFEEERRPSEKRRSLAQTFLSDLRDLKVGDLVVHVDHGIGEFVGLKQLRTSGQAPGANADLQEFLELRYHGDDKLFVPVERLDLIQ